MSEILFLYGKLRTGEFHDKGGGFVEDTATVPKTVKVGPMCKVIDTAQVLGGELKGQVIVCNQAIVQGASLISGHAVIRDNAVVNSSQINDYSVIKDNAVVTNSIISGNSVVRKNANITGVELEHFDSEPCDTGCDV